MLLVPLIILIFYLYLPIYYIVSKFKKSKKIKYLEEKKRFILKHSLTKETYPYTEGWFDYLYKKGLEDKKWWKLENLLSTPPLARDWAIGYTPTLDRYCVELTSGEYQSSERHIIGRINEIKEIEQILSKTEEANVIIVGEEGVGKQTIVDALSNKIYDGKSNTFLNYKRVLKINFELILNEFTDQKQRENFIEQLFKEAISAGNIILVVPNFERYVSSAPGYVDLTIPILKYAVKPTVQFIAITTPYFYEKFIYNNSSLNKSFQKVVVKEISKSDAFTILLEMSLIFEKRYLITVPYETIQKTIEKSEFYITNIPFPEKAIMLLDKTASRAFQSRKEILTPELIDFEISQMTHTPTGIDESTKKILLNLEKYLSQSVISQDEAVYKLSSAIRRSFVLLGKRKKPLASFLFFGPTGVGKTETAKALTKIFFRDENKMLRFDMSQYQTPEDISSLIGDAKTQSPGNMTKAIRTNPYGVLLLDEIEKSNKDLINIFLTMLDEGYYTDGFGEKVDCKNLMIIATSNAASDFIFKNISQGSDSKFQQRIIDYLIEKGYFSPEFLNRFDGVILFKPLDKETISKIAKNMINDLIARYSDSHSVTINVSQQTFDKIVASGFNLQFGARNLQREISNQIGGVIDKKIIESSIKRGERIDL
jgi:ATP-dependent Clp protease ATP-binding subunit ClpC